MVKTNLNIVDFIKNNYSTVQYKDISKMYNVSENTVYRICRKLNLPKKVVYNSTEDINDIRRLCEKGLSHKEISNILNKPRRLISYICHKHNIHNDFYHGYSRNSLYKVLAAVLKRCKDKNNLDYGGRGITVCKRWKRIKNFYEWAISSGYVEGLTIDRINNDGNYSCGQCSECIQKNWPMNCKWSTYKEQARNRRSNVFIFAWKENKTISEWVEDSRCKVTAATLSYRLKHNNNRCSNEELLSLSRKELVRKYARIKDGIVSEVVDQYS